MRRLVITATSVVQIGMIWIVAREMPPYVRDWAPFVYVSVGYYLTGYLFVAPSRGLEAWLLKWDHRWLGDPTTRFARWPWWLIAYLDIVYMMCFALLPGGFAALAVTGHSFRANRYWTMVLAADFGAFAPLSVFQTRPPWIIETPAVLSASRVHRLASYFVKSATTGVNTFPSGHVAVTIAVALGVISSLPLIGIALLICAASIAVACVVGRYHYTVDVLAGAALGLAVCAVAAMWGV
ncbi:MAG TPA: phosphatase PAP2 family protein [Vicinamibacterales bacterium]|nr:phosphatase PAP2 family protein [Vicinamibacterales bacterium]